MIKPKHHIEVTGANFLQQALDELRLQFEQRVKKALEKEARKLLEEEASKLGLRSRRSK